MNKLIIALVILLVVVGGYMVYSNSSPSAPASTLQTTGAIAPVGQAGKPFDFARALLSINTIKLDYSFLTESPAWASLIDFGVTLREPVKGRRNPFAPLNVDSTSVAAVTATVPTAASTTGRQ